MVDGEWWEVMFGREPPMTWAEARWGVAGKAPGAIQSTVRSSKAYKMAWLENDGGKSMALDRRH
jgi:hypothetical protein